MRFSARTGRPSPRAARPASPAAEGARRPDQRVLSRGVADLMNTRSDAMRLVLKRYKESTQLHQDPGSLGSAAGVSQAALVRNLHGRANCPRRAVNDPIDQ